jgi:translation elongation factor EF-4
MIWFLFVQHKKKKVDILLNGTPADPLASLVHRSNARDYGLRLVQVIFQFILIFFCFELSGLQETEECDSSPIV